MLRWSHVVVLVLLASCGDNSNNKSSFKVSGTVSGLTGSGLVLSDGLGDTLAISGNGPFTFPDVTAGASVSVTVSTQPAGETCAVSGGDAPAIAADLTTVTVTCSAGSFLVHASVTGLLGTGLVLQDNGGDDLAVAQDGTFAFATPVVTGQTYHVTVSQQPSNPKQGCTVAMGDGTVGTSDVTVTVTCSTGSFAIGGTVTGLAGSGLVLDNNGTALAVSADGAFMFPTAQPSGSTYDITVRTQPSSPTQTCQVTGGTGTVGGGSVTSIAVTCSTNTYMVGGTVVGLLGTGLVLEDNGGDDLAIAGDGTFAFATSLPSGAMYAVTVATQPSGPTQACRVIGGTGTIAAGPVSSIVVDCTSDRCGNDIIEGSEVCDGIDLAGATCESLGHAPGTLACAADCKTYDASGCTGGWVAANTGFSGTVCADGLRYGPQGQTPLLAVCTEDAGVWRGDVQTGSPPVPLADPAWTQADGTNAGAMVTSDTGRAIAILNTNGKVGFFAANATGVNYWGTNANGFTSSPVTWQTGGNQEPFSQMIFAAMLGSSINNYFGGWDPASGQAIALHGNSSSTDLACSTNGQTTPACAFQVPVGAGITGTVTSIASGNDNPSSSTLDVHVAVNGTSAAATVAAAPDGATETGTTATFTVDGHHFNVGDLVTVTGVGAGYDGTWPVASVTSPTQFTVALATSGLAPAGGGTVFLAGGDIPAGPTGAGGGIYWSCNNGASYVEDDSGIADSDKPRVYKLVADRLTYVSQTTARTCPSSGSSIGTYASVMYAALLGGASIYKTTEGGATWAPSNTGLPSGVDVYSIAIDCPATTNGVVSALCPNDQLLYAATSAGVYKSIDAGATWKLDGLEGSAVRAVVTEGAGLGAFLSASPNGAVESGTTATFTGGTHYLNVGDQVTIVGVPVAGYNGTFTVTSVISPDSFTVTLPTTGLAASGGGSEFHTHPRVFAATDQSGGVFQNNVP